MIVNHAVEVPNKKLPHVDITQMKNDLRPTWISVSERADMMAPDLTLALHAATYHAGIPTQSSSHATIVGPFHSANGVPAFMASSRSSWRENMLEGVFC